jgi:hypothetical protein
VSSYNKSETTFRFGIDVIEDKSMSVSEDIIKSLDKMMEMSPYTKGEIANRLGVTVNDLNRTLDSDIEQISVYDMTHIAGCLGYRPVVFFEEHKDDF